MTDSGSDPRAGTVAAAESDFRRFQVHDPLAIAAVLRGVMAQRALVSVSFGGGGHSFVSALLAVRPESEEVLFDFGPDAQTNAELIASPRIMLAMNLDNVPVQFLAAGARAAMFEGRPAFAVAFPAAVMRMQRREFYRLHIPPGENTCCEIRRDPADPWPLRLAVCNIGGGGVALEDWPDGQGLETHRIYRGCRLLLGEEANFPTDLEVVYSLDRLEPDGTRLRRCGARFVDMPGKVVSGIQRYITRLERYLHAEQVKANETSGNTAP